MKTIFLQLLLISICVGQQRPASDETASIEGIVVNELTNAPIKKAEVTVNFPRPTTAITDASGHFAIHGIQPGSNALTVSHRDFLPGKQRAWEYQAGIDNLTLQPGEARKDIKIGLLPGITIRGRVIDEDGNPLSSCRVQVLKQKRQKGTKQFEEVSAIIPMSIQVAANPMSTRHQGKWQFGILTNDQGEYHISHLPAGSFYLHAACQQQPLTVRPFSSKDAPVDYAEYAYEEQFYPGTPIGSEATKINFEPGTEIRDVDFQMHKIPVVSIRGRIAYSGALSPQTFVVAVFQKNKTGWTLGPKETFVEPSGEFVIHGIRPGSYVLSARSGFIERQLEGHYDIAVGESPIRDVVVPVIEGMTVSGTVEWEKPVGQRVIEQPRNSVMQLYAVGEPMNGAIARVKEDGSFSFPSVKPGVWALDYRPPTVAFVKSLRLGDQEVSPDRFTITPGPVGPLRVLMGVNGAEISGTVHSDKPPGERVSVGLWRDGGVRSAESLLMGADEQGRFTLTGLRPGRYHICAMEMKADSEIPTMDQDFFKAMESRSEEVSVAEGDHVNRDLKVIPSEVIADALKEIE